MKVIYWDSPKNLLVRDVSTLSNYCDSRSRIFVHIAPSNFLHKLTLIRYNLVKETVILHAIYATKDKQL